MPYLPARPTLRSWAASFTKDNGKAIRLVCREFVVLCKKLNLFSAAFVAIDGSKFKAVNNRDRNFTKAKMARRLQQIDESIERYLGQIASADRYESPANDNKGQRLNDKIRKRKHEMGRLKELAVQMIDAPDGQVPLTGLDARSMATSGPGTGMVGYNVQTAVDTKHPLIVAHEVTNQGHDRHQLTRMAKLARDAECLRRLDVDHQIEFRRLLNWGFGRVRASWNAISVNCVLLFEPPPIRSIR